MIGACCAAAARARAQLALVHRVRVRNSRTRQAIARKKEEGATSAGAPRRAPVALRGKTKGSFANLFTRLIIRTRVARRTRLACEQTSGKGAERGARKQTLEEKNLPHHSDAPSAEHPEQPVGGLQNLIPLPGRQVAGPLGGDACATGQLSGRVHAL